jgi:hypothetical protein
MSEKRFVIILLIASTLRGIFDFALMKLGFWSIFFNFFYLFVLYLSIVGTVHYLCSKFYKAEPSDIPGFFFGYAPYWLFLFPVVPVVTHLTHSNYRMTIPLFSYIPSFMVNNNYLPTGMVYIIPLMFFFFFVHAKKYYQLSIIQLFWPVLIIFWADYLLLYQWLLNLGYYLMSMFSVNTFFAVYGMLMLGWGAPFVYYAYKKCNLSKEWLVIGAAVFYSFVFLLALTVLRYYCHF